MAIKILPDEVASQIAAGEVVERPASVVKELLENALDAGAGTVTITIQGAGRQLIEVADDGCGIPAGELALAVARHATSKLSSAKDLFQISSLGFRGEALASIGSVSRMTLTSCSTESGTGGQVRVEGGKILATKSIGAPRGTVVRVEGLFFNVPARLKFLKKDTTERRRIDELVTRYAVAYPEVRILLRQEGRVAVQTSGNGNHREALTALYGIDVARKMLQVDAQYPDLKLSGFISPVGLTRSNRRELTFFVNGRWVQDPSLSTALTRAYHNLLMVGRFPIAILFLQMLPEDVDVNVHPTKSEVRFKDRNRVFADVQRSVRRALLSYTPVPNMNTQLRWSPEASPGRSPGEEKELAASWGSDFLLERNKTPGSPQDSEADARQAEFPAGKVPLLRLVGQVATTYLVAEGPDGLYLVDQHAAHERVLFERFLASQATGIPSQTLLEPVSVDLLPHQARLLVDQLPLLTALGFRVEEFGRNTFLVRAIPVLLTGLSPEAALRVLVEDFEEDESPLENEKNAKVIARVCKRAAVKAGKVLSREEQQALLRDLEACESPRTCPHGRPTMIHLSVDLLERQFGRRGAR